MFVFSFCFCFENVCLDTFIWICLFGYVHSVVLQLFYLMAVSSAVTVQNIFYLSHSILSISLNVLYGVVKMGTLLLITLHVTCFQCVHFTLFCLVWPNWFHRTCVWFTLIYFVLCFLEPGCKWASSRQWHKCHPKQNQSERRRRGTGRNQRGGHCCCQLCLHGGLYMLIT